MDTADEPKDTDITRIKIAGGTGFYLKFFNGYTLSIQIGVNAYCDNWTNYYDPDRKNPRSTICESFEVAIFDDNMVSIELNEEGSTCIGWVKAKELPKWIERASKL